jgi:hypothetical protein
MLTLLSAVAPLFMLTIGVVFATIFKFAPIKSFKIKAIGVASFAVIAAVGLLIPSWFYKDSLNLIYSFSSFSFIFEGIAFLNDLGIASFIAALVLVGIFEISLTASFTLAFKIAAFRNKQKIKTDQKDMVKQNVALQKVENIETSLTQPDSALKKREEILFDEKGLRKDEKTVMELFLYGKVTQITPSINASQPEGYSFEGMPQLDWDTKRTRQALDSLVRKGFLKAELIDKIITCMACGSANIRVKKLCPECMSLRLRKEGLIEHFSCGAVERQAAFESGKGDLICPKCKAKLHLIGSDYRMLPPSYVCLGCNVRSSEPLLVVKCDDCGSTAQLDEEPEIFLYKYTANSELPMKEMQQIKPIEVCTKFFRNLGYTVVAPAYVSGRSGTKHLFDILILGRVGWIETEDPMVTKSSQRKDNGNTVIQLLIGSKPIDLETMTRIYGMINDIDCESLIFVIPGMTENARNYASAYNMKISEGKTIEEALANSKIPKAGEKNA